MIHFITQYSRNSGLSNVVISNNKIYHERFFFSNNKNQAQSQVLNNVRVRYAPSPTGMMHIGGLRTALYNYLFARKHKGKFILRIQDTDQNRNFQGSIQNIFKTLKWIDIQADQSIEKQNQQYKPYIQSERLSIYKSIEKMLLKRNLAYPCFCTHQNQNKTKINKSSKKSQKFQQSSFADNSGYDGKCRTLTMQQIKQKIGNKQPYAIRLKNDIFSTMPQMWKDFNFGAVPFVKFDDFIIVRSDGWPTYHFANVIDDWKMEITHVMRGEQWLTNTSKHIYLYKVLGAKVPQFVHLPLIHNMNGKKLAKRDPLSSLEKLCQQYEAQAVKNFILRLGRNPKQQSQQKSEQNLKPDSSNTKKSNSKQTQILSNQQMTQIFDLQNLMKSPAKFDIKILNSYNRKVLKNKWKLYKKLEKQQNQNNGLSQQKQQLKNLLSNQIIEKFHKYLPQSKQFTSQKLKDIWEIIHDRISINSDIDVFSYIFMKKSPQYSHQNAKIQKDLKLLFGSKCSIQKGNLINYDISLYEKNKKILHNLRLVIQHIVSSDQFGQVAIGQKISEFIYQQDHNQIQNQDVYHLLRFIITQQKSGPSILKIIQFIGREKTLHLLQRFDLILQKQGKSNLDIESLI